MKFEELTPDIFKKAIDIYIKVAYENDGINVLMAKQKYEAIKKAETINEILSLFKKEEVNQVPSYKIQLGSKYYPFLKLVLEKTTFSDDYGFYIDRHSEYIAVDSSSPTFKEELKLKEKTKELKLKIENELEKNGIPTYRAYVRDYIKKVKSYKSGKKKGKLILLVEDDVDINEMHRLELTLLGYDVESVYNGYDAIRMVENKYFDLMLLDLMMSGISGQEVIKRVGDEIDIVVLSALNDSYTRNVCFKLGAKGYLTKPVSKARLESFLNDFFSKKVKDSE